MLPVLVQEVKIPKMHSEQNKWPTQIVVQVQGFTQSMNSALLKYAHITIVPEE